MAASLHWKEKVVRNILAAVMVVVSVSHLQGQTSGDHLKTFTFSYRHASLKTVVENVAQVSGLHIIYSPDKINMFVPVSLVVRNKTITEILGILEQQTNLSFRMKDRHLIIKPSVKESSTQTYTISSQVKRLERIHNLQPVAFQPSTYDAFVTSAAPVEVQSREEIFLGESRSITHWLKSIPSITDTTFPKKLPDTYIRRMNTQNRHRGWFVSAGALINDYSAGFEIQAGIRQLYAVYSPSWLSSTGFHGGYGLGSSVPLSDNLFFNPVYTYSEVSQKRNFTSEPGSPVFSHIQYRTFTRHHQFKLMLQYVLSPNVRLTVGPAFNRTVTQHDLAAMKIRSVVVSEPLSVYSTNPRATWTESVRVYSTTATQEANEPSIRTWLGWEASLSYRINFFRRP